MLLASGLVRLEGGDNNEEGMPMTMVTCNHLLTTSSFPKVLLSHARGCSGLDTHDCVFVAALEPAGQTRDRHRVGNGAE